VSKGAGFLGSKRGFQLAAFCNVEDRIACSGLRIRVVPDAVSSSDDCVFANAVWFGFSFHFVAEELRDGAQVEVDEQDGDEDLAGGESSNPSTSGEGDKIFAIVCEAAVQGLGGLAGVFVELVPFRAHERERLFLPQGVFFGEGDRVLLTDPVKKFGEVVLFDSGTFLVRRLLRHLADQRGRLYETS